MTSWRLPNGVSSVSRPIDPVTSRGMKHSQKQKVSRLNFHRRQYPLMRGAQMTAARKLPDFYTRGRDRVKPPRRQSRIARKEAFEHRVPILARLRLKQHDTPSERTRQILRRPE